MTMTTDEAAPKSKPKPKELSAQEIADLVLDAVSKGLPKVRKARGSTDDDGNIRIVTRDWKGREHASKHMPPVDADAIARLHRSYWANMLIENRRRSEQDWDDVEETVR